MLCWDIEINPKLSKPKYYGEGINVNLSPSPRPAQILSVTVCVEIEACGSKQRHVKHVLNAEYVKILSK
jgi:Ni,Fe-hydrogenase III small subunit